MKTAILTASVALLASCSIVKPKVVYIQRDSLITVRETIIRDSIITVPGDTVVIELPSKRDTVFVTRSGRASASVSISKGRLQVVANCDEQNIIISRLQEQLHHYQSTETDSVKTEIVTVKHIPSMYKFTFWGFFVLAAAVTALLLKTNNPWVAVIATLSTIFRKASKKNDGKG